MDILTSCLEIKAASDFASGEFEGYGAIFGTQDSHGDLILPGAFRPSLETRAAAGRGLPMYVQHGPYVPGGDHLPVGTWKDVREDGRGLKMVGQIAGMDTAHGQRIRSLVRDGALRGLSIEFNVPPGGATFGTKAGEPKRTIAKAQLHGVSLVADPSHPQAVVDSIKSTRGLRGIELASVGDLRDLLQEAGFSGREAKAMAGAAWRARSDDAADAEAAAIADILQQSAARIAAHSERH